MGDIAAAYESYCDFIELIADEDILASIGLEGVTKGEGTEVVKTVKTNKKRNGLIAAVGALIEGVVGFFRSLLGLEQDETVKNVTMYAAPGAPALNIKQIESELMRYVNILAKTDRNSPEFTKYTKKCEDLLKEFRDKADEVAAAGRKYKKQYGDKPFSLNKSGVKTYEANIGRTTSSLRKLMKAAKNSETANREVVRYVSDFLNIVKAISTHCEVDKPNKAKAWTDKKAEKAMGKAAKDVEKSTSEALRKSEELDKREAATK